MTAESPYVPIISHELIVIATIDFSDFTEILACHTQSLLYLTAKEESGDLPHHENIFIEWFKPSAAPQEHLRYM